MERKFDIHESFDLMGFLAEASQQGIQLYGDELKTPANGFVEKTALALTVHLYEADSDLNGLYPLRRLAGDLAPYMETLAGLVNTYNV